MVYFVPSRPSFIPAYMKDDGTYPGDKWPSDAVLLNDAVAEEFWKKEPPLGKTLGAIGSTPAWVDLPRPTASEILTLASARLQDLIQEAALQRSALTNRISVLQDSVDLEMATPKELVELPIRQDQLLEWKRHAILLGRVTSGSGWPSEVNWPTAPEQGMDLTVSAVIP